MFQQLSVFRSLWFGSGKSFSTLMVEPRKNVSPILKLTVWDANVLSSSRLLSESSASLLSGLIVPLINLLATSLIDDICSRVTLCHIVLRPVGDAPLNADK